MEKISIVKTIASIVVLVFILGEMVESFGRSVAADFKIHSERRLR